MPITLGDPVPDFERQATNNSTIKLSQLRGKNVILYFYPKDATPGCTLQSQQFRDHYAQFKPLNTEIFGISRDSLASHEKFKCKQALPFDLIVDSDEYLCQFFDVIKDKMMYGKKVRGIERSTFLIDARGRLCAEWRKVKVEGHVSKVLRALQEL